MYFPVVDHKKNLLMIVELVKTTESESENKMNDSKYDQFPDSAMSANEHNDHEGSSNISPFRGINIIKSGFTSQDEYTFKILLELLKKKTEIISNFQEREGDTGSTEVQVALLTERINQLTAHMAANRHDYHTQRGLLKLVGQRRRLLAYLNREDVSRYNKLIKRLGLRK